MDEEQLVRFLQKAFDFSGGKGIGDDAAVMPLSGHAANAFRIVAKDLFVQGTHFDLAYFTLSEAAEKAVGANVSDMAAMGGLGKEIYLGIGFPPKGNRTEFQAVFRGIRKACRRWNLQLGGGDVSKAPCWFFSVTICGHAVRPVFRDGARDGDAVGLVGRTGESALGLRLLQSKIPDPVYPRRHVRINPPLRAALELGRVASAMIDVSDGLLKDLKRLLSASRVGAELWVDKIPITRGMQHCCKLNNWDPLQLALTGGEDYALLFTISPARLPLLDAAGIPHRIIGRIHKSPQRLVLTRGGRSMEAPAGGYDHFLSG